MIANRESDMMHLLIFFCGFMLALQIVVLFYVVNAAAEKGVLDDGKFPPAIPIIVYFVSTALVFLTGSIIPHI